MRKGNEYRPLQDVMLALSELVDRSGMSLREVQRKLEKENINLYNVCSVANGKPETLSSIVRFDGFIGKILRVIGKDEYDLMERTINNLSAPTSPSFQEDLSIELKDFLSNPDSRKYIEYAYKMYQRDKLTEELDKMRGDIGENS